MNFMPMDLRQQKKLRDDFLVTVWEMHDGNYGGDQSTRELCQRIGIDFDKEGSIVAQLHKDNLVSWAAGFDWISLTPRGIKEAERLVELRYAEKETRVLKKIYDLSGQNTIKPVGFHELVPALGITDREVSGICKGLEEQGFIEWPGGDYVQITAAGVHAIESLGQPTPKAGGDTYNMNINTLHGAAQQGPGNVQSVNIAVTTNPDFDQAVAVVLQLIQASRLPDDEIEELREEVVKLNKLALSEPKSGLLERAKARIDFVRLGLQGTEVLIKAGPHLDSLWEILKRKFHVT
jgi:DNA-binding MarR family transcriptional regulator